MAAGLGFKTFTTGEVLTAADVNGYLMQGILVFATEAARNSAITSPQEGQFAFTKDNNSLWYYTGSAWVASGATGDIEGVTAGVGISGGGTSGTVTITNSMATAIDAKGDLVAGTGADTFARLAVGANDTVLTAASGEATGLKWAAPAGGSKTWTLLNAGGTNLTAAQTITISGISNVEDLMIFITQGSSASAASEIGIRFNGDTGTNYGHTGFSIEAGNTYAASNFGFNVNLSNNQLYLAKLSSNAASQMCGGIWVSGCKSTGIKAILGQAGASAGGGNSQNTQGVIGFYSASAAITSVSAHSLTGNFDDGKIYVYGA